MKKKYASFLCAGLLATAVAFPTETAITVRSFAGQASAAQIPSLDELAADWMEVKTLCNFPATYNYWGGLLSTPNLTAFSCLAFPPYSQGGELGVLMVDGAPLATAYSRWYPYQLVRRTVRNGVTIESAIRLPFEQRGVFCRLALSNGTAKSRSLNLGLLFRGQVRQFAGATWAWTPPWPGDNKFEVSVPPGRQLLAIKDRLSPAAIVFSFGRVPERLRAEGGKGTAEWNITLAPGATVMIQYAAAIARDAKTAAESAARWTSTFDASFAQAKARWEERWQAAFIPRNKHFSGHLPTLVTGDAKIRRVYYHGALVTQLLCRTNLPLNKRVFVTGGPRWSLTVTYFWDTGLSAHAWAMLEPVTMREHLAKWLAMDLRKCYAVDYMSGKGVGPWYAANDWSVFRSGEAYLDVTGDKKFLRQTVAGKTVLEHMVRIATAYAKLKCKAGLASYGENGNLLECAPEYIHCVASLNAANVHMLRRAAEYLDAAGEKARAADLRAQAAKVQAAVLGLYSPGEGTWNAMHLDGHKVATRHCYDYIVVGQALENELTSRTKREMTAFVENELRTKTWMRAMSLKDPAAGKSDRPDHGPLGSYDGWPPLVMDVMCRCGAFDRAVDFLRGTEAMTHEGPFAQGHEFLGRNQRGYDPIVRIACRGLQDSNTICGAAFMEVIIGSFFGYRPDLPGEGLQLLAPHTPRGFAGELRHVPYQGEHYRLISGEDGIRRVLERSR
jgi:hypothetical protein